MVETHDCTFCGSEIEPGTGIMFVKNDGEILRFCSSKCEKNAEIRASRDLEWTATEEEAQT